uniref:Uncharacterized protein n=1 Tax=Trichuris muris TaxID=70415 RepID=A0A5S6QD57_TRIMR
MFLHRKSWSLLVAIASKSTFRGFWPSCAPRVSALRRTPVFIISSSSLNVPAILGAQSGLLGAARFCSTNVSTDDEDLLSIIGEALESSPAGDALVGADLRTLLVEGDSPFLYRWYGHLLDFAHTNLGMPWWLSIAASALAIRLLLFPLVTISNQRNYSSYHNAIPTLLKHHVRISQARIRVDLKAICEEEAKMAEYSSKANLAPIGAQLINIAIAVTAFSTQFFALRKLALLGCEDMNSGGALWFVDLTSNDPLLALVASFTYFLWMLIRMEQSVRIGGPQTVTATVGRVGVASLTIGSLFVFGSVPSATLCFCITDFTLNAAFAMLYGTEIYRNMFNISHPVVLPNPSKEGYIDLPGQIAKGYESAMGKIRAVRRANIAAIKSTGHGILLYDADEMKEYFKKCLNDAFERENCLCTTLLIFSDEQSFPKCCRNCRLNCIAGTSSMRVFVSRGTLRTNLLAGECHVHWET